MAKLPSITRRAVVRAFPFIGAVAFAPVIMAEELKAAPAEEISSKVDRLCHELSVALDEFANGTFRAVIEPDSKSRMPVVLQNMRLARQDASLVGFLKNAPANARATYHAAGFASALRDLRGGGWVVSDIPSGDAFRNVVMFVRNDDRAENSIPAFG